MKDRLIEAATTVRRNAYAPYSNYKVGAAVLGMNGRVYAACNVENASYGLTVCAERNAICCVVADGCVPAIALALATEDGSPPCGACLQLMAEFATDATEFMIYLADESGAVEDKRLAASFPCGFKLRAGS